jgi:transcriptional regulator with XRE-family HTH domain
MISAYVGVYLRCLRKTRHLTLTRVAELSKMHVGIVSRIERGSYKPTLEQLLELCAVYGFKVSDLIALATEAMETSVYEALANSGHTEMLDYIRPFSVVVDFANAVNKDFIIPN